MKRDTEFLIYDYKRHRYYLNEDCLDANPYKDSTELTKNLKNQSNNLYSWIYSRIPRFSKNYAEYVLATSDDYKDAIRDALLACFEADIKSGYAEIKNYAGNVEQGSFIPDREIIEKLVPVEAKIALEKVGGDNIFYRGYYPDMEQDRYERYQY